jgi:hypothetical protein
MTAAGEPLMFTTNGYTLAPFFVADPEDYEEEPVQAEGAEDALSPFDRRRRGPRTQPYHVYVRRSEPEVVFGSVSTGVANRAGADGLTFLDRVWDQAPFASHDQFVATVERVAGELGQAGLFTAEQRTAIVDGARRAEPDLRL